MSTQPAAMGHRVVMGMPLDLERTVMRHQVQGPSGASSWLPCSLAASWSRRWFGGVISGSLALLADAGHMLTDVGALVLAYVGIRLGQRSGDERRSYGYARLEVLAAFVNGITLLALSAWIWSRPAYASSTP